MAEHKKHTESSNPKADVQRKADELRARTNSLADERREDSFRRGMQLIYGGASGIPTKTRSA